MHETKAISGKIAMSQLRVFPEIVKKGGRQKGLHGYVETSRN